jgi:hypothetical protein
VKREEEGDTYVVLAGPGWYGPVPLLGFGPGLGTGLGTGLDTGLGTGLGLGLAEVVVVGVPPVPPPAIIALFPAPPKPLKSPAIAPCIPYCLTRFQTSLSVHGSEGDPNGLLLLLLLALLDHGSLNIASAELAMDKMRRSCATM